MLKNKIFLDKAKVHQISLFGKFITTFILTMFLIFVEF